MHGRSLDAVEDFALHAVLNLPPPHHQLQHLVDGVFRVFLEKGKAGGDEPAGKNSPEPSGNLQPPLKPGCASPEGASPVAPGAAAPFPFHYFRSDCSQSQKSNGSGFKGRTPTYPNSPKPQGFCRKMSSRLTPLKLCNHIAPHSLQTTSKAGMTKRLSSHLLGNGVHPPNGSLGSLVSQPNPPQGPWPTCRMKSWTMLCSDT